MKSIIALLFSCFLIPAAQSKTFGFSYTYDASVRGTAGNELRVIVEGTLADDGDTIFVEKVIAASLNFFPYSFSSSTGVRANDPTAIPRISLSGQTLDLWVCPAGFTGSLNGAGDCQFGNEGGFLISDSFASQGTSLAGSPSIQEINSDGNNTYRDQDSPINIGNWSIKELWTPAFVPSGDTYSFTYVFDASSRGTAGHELSGLIDGTLQSDGDTIVINRVLAASLDGYGYNFDSQVSIRAQDPTMPATMSLSGQKIDFWVCPKGFSSVFSNSGGDCPFGSAGGFLVSENFFTEDGGAIAGIPAIEEIVNGSNRYRDIDNPLNRSNFNVAKVEAYRFSYTFDGSVRGTSGNKLEGYLEGSLEEDRDTISVNNIFSASLAGNQYRIVNPIGLRANDASAVPKISLSGNTLDLWVCTQGFSTFNSSGDGDCPFGNEGGFLISGEFSTAGAALAGIQSLEELNNEGNNIYRDQDAPISVNNWNASKASVSALELAPKPPELKYTLNGKELSITWNSISNATGYTVFFAPFPSAEPVFSIDAGVNTTLTGSLPGGTALYIAVQAKNPAGTSLPSNVETIAIE